MGAKQRISLIVIGLLLVLGAATYGVVTLTAKMNDAKELKQQLAESDQPDESDPVQGEGNKDSDGGGDEDGDQDGIAGGDGQGVSPSPGSNPGDTVTPGKPAGGQGQTGKSGADTPGSTGGSGGGGASGTPANSGGSGSDTPAAKPEPSATAPTTGGGKASKSEIDAAVTASMESLRSTCKSTSSKLVSSIKAELAENKEAALETLQSEYLGQVVAAEASCDAQFNQLVGDAQAKYKDAGLSASEMPDWNTEYERAKQDARSAALVEIAAALD
ncbi:hypothetical protein [Paenibacillus sp. PAMC21692]|uniref:hypothetical protein n=1 Tax=Paenibacillus sp. PAMC21692 TaxID=2762320 RepID=UPI00164D246E|nr:hypothetical protein [Paenibacillus sp. PAMC21692]QNK58184.1 hypothetical protein H7F31_04335 [Paenibacillus sp. PAMC21692]